jgi:dipeptidyl aminopeptidase/acylaminoacyl peptidase
MRYTIEQFMQTTKVLGGVFSPDEESVLFTSNATGVFNVYNVSLRGGQPQQLTHSATYNMYGMSYFPDGERILVSRERGGNEIYHLCVLDPGGEVLDLTPGDKVAARYFGPNADGSSFYCGTNERDQRHFDIYKVNFKTLSRELLYADTEGYEFGCISADGRYIALGEPRTRERADIFLYDTEQKQLRRLTTHDDDSCYWASCFDWNSKYLYYTTDRNSDYLYVERIELKTGRIEQIVKDDCNCSIAFSPGGKYQIITRDRDYLFQIEITHVESGERVPFSGRPGEGVAGFSFSLSGRRMVFYLKSDLRPGDLCVFDLQTLSARQFTNSLTPEIDSSDLVDSETVRYCSFDGLEIPSLLWKPRHVSALNKAPALVYVHGGPGGQSRKGYDGETQFLVNQGYVVLAPNYRGSSGHGKTFRALDNGKHTQDPLLDCIEAGRYLASLDYVDSSKVAIMGASYGGFLTLAALTFHPHEFAAGIDLFGPSNWHRTLASFPPYWKSALVDFYRKVGDPTTDGEILKKISPLFHADAIVKPLLVLQGTNDPRVLKCESDELVEAIKRKNGIVEYVVFDDEGHGFTRKTNRIYAYQRIINFLDRYVKGGVTMSESGVAAAQRA